MDLLSSVLTRPLPLAVWLVAVTISSWPPLTAIASSLLLAPFSTSTNPFALMSPCFYSSSSALPTIFCTFSM